MRTITRFDSREPDNEALLTARIAAEEQGRFARRLVGGLMAFMLLWLLALLFFKQPGLFNLSRLLSSEARTSAAHPAAPLTSQVVQLNRELSRLQRQLGDALTQTLTMKLEALEDRIRLGQAGLQDLELLQSIRQDIRMLAKQSHASVPAAQPAVAQQTLLLDKLVRLENLLYLSLASFALVTVAAVGYWLRWSARMRKLDADLSRLRFQLEHRRD